MINRTRVLIRERDTGWLRVLVSMGARPVRRAIQRLLANPLSVMMVTDQAREGDTVRVTLRAAKVAFATGEKALKAGEGR